MFRENEIDISMIQSERLSQRTIRSPKTDPKGNVEYSQLCNWRGVE